MRKITKLILTCLAIGTLAGCDGGKRDEERDQRIVEAVLRLAICQENGTIPLDPLGEPTKLKADEGKYLVIANSWVREGEKVTISWSTNREDAFEFLPGDENTTRANPVYPEHGEEPKGVSLTATATLFNAKATARFVFYLYPPSALFARSDLGSIREEAVPKDRVWVEGFVYAMIEHDWNLVYIADGSYGIGLYRLDFDFPTVPDMTDGGKKRALQIGDYVKAVGKYSPYQGLAEVGFLETVEIIEVPDYAETPKVKVLTEDNFIDVTTLMGFDAAKVRIEGLVFTGKYLDKEKKPVSGLDTTGAEHRDVVFKAGDTEICLNVSYHIGPTKQAALKTFLNGLTAGQTVTFEGPLGWYNDPNLAFTDISQLKAV
ncbi:MAG: hypothetical protein ACOX3K_01010 [Bacilli bacterium]|jgi:hypothetical protein